MSLKGPLLCIKQGCCCPGKFLFYYEHYYCTYSIETFTFTGLCLQVILFIQEFPGHCKQQKWANQHSNKSSVRTPAAHHTPGHHKGTKKERKNKVSNNSAVSMEGSS